MSRWFRPPLSLFLALVAALLPAPVSAQEPFLWGGLKPGPHAVGYQALYQLDPTRQYDPEYPTDPARPPAPRPRPILICLWYPARATSAPPMAYREYLDVPSDDPLVAPFARRLMPYVRDVVCEEILGQKPNALNPTQAEAFARLLAAPTLAVKNAAPAAGRFPVVIYHPGLGGTYEDNAVLFEYLASHGYLVVSSAYPKADASILNIDWNLERSFRDMEFLARYARGLPFADADRLAAMGHSYGAQAALAWRAEPSSAVAAVVSIDSTVENVGIDHHGFSRLKDHFEARRHNLTAPTLRFASLRNQPRFATLEPYLKHAPRYEATVDGLGHNDYLSQGAIRPALLPDRWPNAAKARRLRASYERVCEHVLWFLDATLKERPQARECLQPSLRGEGPDEEFRLQYRPPAPPPPTARQLAQALAREGAEKAAALLRASRDDVDVGAVLGGLRATVMDYQGRVVVDEGLLKEATTLFTLAGDLFPKSAAVRLHLGAACAAAGDRKAAIAAFRQALALAPEAEADPAKRAQLIREIEGKLQKLGWAKDHPDGR